MMDLTDSAVALLAAAKPYNSFGWGDSERFTPDETTTLELKLVPEDRLDAASSIEEVLRREKADSDKRWIEYYNKATDLGKKVKALEAKLAAIGQEVGTEAPNPTIV